MPRQRQIKLGAASSRGQPRPVVLMARADWPHRPWFPHRCKGGPLRKLWLWLECALVAWPAAALVGKADDDAWIRLPGVALHASRALAAAAATAATTATATAGTAAGTTAGTAAGSSAAPAPTEAAAPRLLWASIDSFHWHEGLHRPIGYTGQRWAHRQLSYEA